MKRIGLIGCGSWGRYVLRDLVALNCEVSVVAINKNSLQNAIQFKANAIFDSIDALPPQEGYVVCTPAGTHFEVIQQLVQKSSQVPIFVEKPMCNNTQEAEYLAKQLPNTLFVMDKWRYHNGVLALRDLIASKKYGNVVNISTKRLSKGTIHPDADTIWHLAPHDVAIVYELLGYLPEPSFARLDITHGELRGMTACLGKNPFAMIEVSDRHTAHYREIKVFFEDAIVVFSDGYSTVLTVYKTHQLDPNQEVKYEEAIPFELKMPLYDELDSFIKHLNGGPPPKSNANEGAMTVKIISQLKAMAQ